MDQTMTSSEKAAASLEEDCTKTLENAIGAIRERFFDWEKRYSEANRANSNDDTGFLSKEISKALRTLILDFYKNYKKETAKDIGLTEWECGLGQILDISDERISKILPYLLTSYMYNHINSENSYKYFKSFIEEEPFFYDSQRKEKGYEAKRNVNNDYFFAARSIQSDTEEFFPEENFTSPKGIGILFSGAIFTSDSIGKKRSQNRKLYKDISELFRFPEVERVSLGVGEHPFDPKNKAMYKEDTIMVRETHLVPLQQMDDFLENISRKTLMDSDNITRLYQETYNDATRKKHHVYLSKIYEEIFVVWYRVCRQAALRNIPQLKSEPNARICYSLMKTALRLSTYEEIASQSASIEIRQKSATAPKDIFQKYLLDDYKWLHSAEHLHPDLDDQSY